MKNKEGKKSTIITTPLGDGELVSGIVRLLKPAKVENMETGEQEFVSTVVVSKGKFHQDAVRDLLSPQEMRDGIIAMKERINNKLKALEEIRRENKRLVEELGKRLEGLKSLIDQNE